MAKELPFFKFEPAEYLTKDISFCSLEAQGLFINICSYYWQRQCDLSKKQLLKRLNHETLFNELISEGVIDLKGDKISIKFLDNQLDEVKEKSKINTINGSRGGRPKKPKNNPNETELKPNGFKTETETKGIREDKIREDKKNDDVDELEKIQNVYDLFVNELKNGKHTIALDSLYMRLKVKKGTIHKILEDYKGQIIIDRKLHKNTHEMLKHFSNYCNTQDRVGKLDEYKTIKLKGAL